MIVHDPASIVHVLPCMVLEERSLSLLGQAYVGCKRNQRQQAGVVSRGAIRAQRNGDEQEMNKVDVCAVSL
jgi:hypothetical protein